VKHLLALGLVLAAFGPSLAPAAEPYSDRLCPEATQPIRDHDAKIANPNTGVDDAIAATARVADAYDRCATEKLASNLVENAHYAQLRSAQYHYEIGHWQGLLGNKGLARDQYQASLKLVKIIIDWQASTTPYYQSNTVNVGAGSSHDATADASNYREAAIEVRDASQKAIAALDAPPPAAPAPQPAASHAPM
jgi:hypothetical protein